MNDAIEYCVQGGVEVVRAYVSLGERQKMEIVMASLHNPSKPLTWEIYKEGGMAHVCGWPLAEYKTKVSLEEGFFKWFRRMLKENVVPDYLNPALRIHSVCVDGVVVWEM